MLEIETALFIVFLVVVFGVMIGIGWYGTTGGAAPTDPTGGRPGGGPPGHVD